MSALVLSGGGAGGAFQVGALLRLYELGHEFDSIYGTSVGALNAAGLRWLGVEGLADAWHSVNEKNVLKRNWLAYLGFGEGLYNASPLYALVDNVVARRPKYASINAYACALDILTGELVYRESRDAEYRDTLLGSAAVPLYMPPVGNLVDGGVRCHTPILRAYLDGHRDILAITCNELKDESRLHLKNRPRGPFKSIKFGLAATEWLQREIFCDDTSLLGLDGKIQIIAPERRIIDTFEFIPEKIEAAISQGYSAASSFAPCPT